MLQIHSGNCLQKIGILELSLIKLLQNEQGCNFFASQCSLFSAVSRLVVRSVKVETLHMTVCLSVCLVFSRLGFGCERRS